MESSFKFTLFLSCDGINGGKVHGKRPGLAEEEITGSNTLSIAGPSGLKILFDYRSALAEVLGNTFGSHDMNQVFPNFRPEPVGLAG